ncbi:orotidine-5'-phosphate decarboxylase [Alicyclobacillus acidiphilus]|uniref:orotidine-5'-phosphate decarboxylase n=1 Tax=Alicyclobacillus acidiphilus TaxID=182455 RepID=UPI000834F7E3|nr:orotidine-5'-phosphate decarboxylase [Alicyclobacillus acidiphilus]
MTADLRTQLMAPEYDDVRKATYIGLDVDSPDAAMTLVDRLSPVVDGFKIGLEMFHRAGMPFVETLLKRDLRIFLDMKLHDIPNTVAGALKAICQYPIEMVNVHALGGRAMLEAARRAVDDSPYQPLLIGVTVLTSLDDHDINQLGLLGSASGAVLRLADLVQASGLDGIVCSAQELDLLKERVAPNFERVVPGTRLASADTHDQARTRTPYEALAAGATRLVFARAVLQAPDPLVALADHWHNMKCRSDSNHELDA